MVQEGGVGPGTVKTCDCLSVWRGVGGYGRLFLSLDKLLCPGDIFVSQEEGVFDSDVVVNVIEIPGVLARHCIFGEGAGEGQLVENCLVPAEEAVVQSLLVSVCVGDWIADMEDLAVVVDVSIVPVSKTLAVEVCVDGSNN